MSEIQDECTDHPHNPLVFIKVCLFTVFLLGVLMRIFIPFENFRHLADILMMLAVLGRLFMYVRALNPARFFPRQEDLSPLQLIEKRETVVATYDQRTRTPLERVISDK